MKSKRTTYLLLIFSILIWTTVGWKIYQAFNANTEQPIAKKIVENLKKDSVVLLLNYKDPFLGGYNASAQAEPRPAKKRIISTNIKPQQKIPTTPEFQFKGTLNIGKLQMAIVQRNNETLTLKKGEILNGFKLTSINENMIILSKNGKKYDLSIR